MKKFDTTEGIRLYLGNDAEQRGVIAALKRSVAGAEGKLHLIEGGTSTGKSKATMTMNKHLQRSGQFDSWPSNQIPPGTLPDKLTALLAAADGNYRDAFMVYKHKSKPFYIVVTDAGNELAPVSERYYPVLEGAAKLIRESAAEGNTICWIADAPVIYQAAPMFKKPDAAKRLENKKAHDEKVGALKSDFGDTLAVHTLNYDKTAVREAFWQKITDYGQPFIDFLERELGHWDKTPEWQKAKSAALRNDRAEYDRAFDVLDRRLEAKTTLLE